MGVSDCQERVNIRNIGNWYSTKLLTSHILGRLPQEPSLVAVESFNKVVLFMLILD